MEHITLVVEEGRGRHRSERSQGPRGSLGSIGHLTAALKGSLPTWRSLRWGSPPISQPHRRGRMPSTHGTRVPLATHFPLQAPAACTVFRDSVCLRVGWETFRSVGEVTPQNLNFFFGCVCVCVFERSDSRVALFPPPSRPTNDVTSLGDEGQQPHPAQGAMLYIYAYIGLNMSTSMGERDVYTIVPEKKCNHCPMRHPP